MLDSFSLDHAWSTETGQVQWQTVRDALKDATVWGNCNFSLAADGTSCTLGVTHPVIGPSLCAGASYTVDALHIGPNNFQATYTGSGWSTVGGTRKNSGAFSTNPLPQYVVKFTGKTAVVKGGKHATYGKADYSICDADGVSNCSTPVIVDSYAATTQTNVVLWRKTFATSAARALKARILHQSSHSGYVVNVDNVVITN
jgi:hypothetical protein